MARADPRKIARYGEYFNATAVSLSGSSGVRIEDVADAMDIHPFMLSPWRKQFRDGVIVVKGVKLDVETAAELRRSREREHQNAELADRIRAAHRESRGTYGGPRVFRALRSLGCRASENRIAQLMRGEGSKARVATVRYTNPVLKRFFAAARNEQPGLDLQAPNLDWAGDITYLKVGSVFDEDRQVEQALRAHIPFYNHKRLHSSPNFVSPATYEQLA